MILTSDLTKSEIENSVREEIRGQNLRGGDFIEVLEMALTENDEIETSEFWEMCS